LQPGRAQTKVESEQEKKIDESYLKLRSPDFVERARAVAYFSQFKKDELSQNVVNEIIDLFIKETERLKQYEELTRVPGMTKDRLPKELQYINTEAFGPYLSNLCKIVGESGDLRVLPLLVNYHLYSEFVINFGELAVEPVINVLRTADNPTRRVSAIFVLRDFLKDKEEGYVASGEAREKIKKAMIDAVSDKEWDVRGVVVKALGESGEKDFIPVLEKVAESDPYKVERDPIPGVDKDVPPGKKVIRYLIRNDAKKALEKLRGKEKNS
jgi:hypothetical protein